MIAKYKSTGLLDSIRERVTTVFFRSTNVWENVRDALIKMSNYMNFGYKNVYGYVMYDSEAVRPYHERHKNLKPMFQHNKEIIRVDTQKDYNRLMQEFKALGIKRRLIVQGLGGFRAGRYRL